MDNRVLLNNANFSVIQPCLNEKINNKFIENRFPYRHFFRNGNLF